MAKTNLQKEFLAQAAPYCKYVPATAFDYAANISLRHRYMYVETPKVACSSIKVTLQRLELDDRNFNREDFEDIHVRNFSPLLRPSQLGNLEAFLQRKDIFKFCFVRNPYTRLLSAWNNKIARNRSQKAQILLQLGKNPTQLEQEVTFSEFVHAIAEQPVSVMDAHWRVQYYQTFQAGIQYDFVGRLENFDEDFAYVLERLYPRVAEITGFVSYEKRHQTQADKLIGEYFTSELSEIVQKIYHIDFEQFGYSKDISKISGVGKK